MAKQLNVNLNIDAQTGKAKQALTELNKILTDIQTNRTITVNDKSLQEAKQAASDLKFHLAQATSVDTGKLNLGAFSQSLKKAGQDLNTLYNKLSVIGPEGQQAFLALSQSIVQADHASLTLGNRLSQLGTTLKNTARWQLSSTLLHGFMGALQGAYGYAQDLNKSLNNIRIVTGQSIDDMARFADEANRAAKSLSATTTAYTDAALIYYQQGLDDKAVKERTETTIKLANVSRQSAEEVSSQMTAIWNNFDDGSKSLEYYADVITKLGAATASSSDEIAQGLQKFASVADTVGLSYEKATAALATVVAETRQSADVVGTAFKTMFARFQGLQLGETLEDGVTLNKYSEALGVIGVNILDANGNLRVMDDILDDTAKKWDTITEAQQVALAETVAGTRQYAQFMAIMNNYDKILANQGLAANSEGTLQEQADIYAESWEAASKRVRAAAQGIYQDLIDDKFFITALNGLEKIIGTVDGAIKGIGGLKTILLSVGAIIASKYATEMPAILQKLVGNFNVLTGAAEKQRITMIQDANAIIQSMEATNAGTKGFQAQIGSMQLVSKMTAELEQKKRNLSKAEIENYELKIKEVQMYGQVVTAIGQEIDALEKESAAQKLRINSNLYQSGNLSKEYISAFTVKQQKAELQSNIAHGESVLKDTSKTGLELKLAREEIEASKKALKELELIGGKTGSSLLKNFSSLSQQAGKMSNVYNEVSNKSEIWQRILQSSTADVDKIKEEILAYADVMTKAGFNTDQFKEAIQKASNTKDLKNALEDLINTDSKLAYQMYDTNEQVEKLKQILINMDVPEAELNKLEEIMKRSGASSQEFAAALEEVKLKYQTLQPHTISLSESFSRLGSAAMALSSAINAIKNIGTIWSDEDLSKGEKLLQTLTSMGMLLPALNTLLDANTLKVFASSFSFKGLTAAIHSTTGATVTFSTVLKALPFGWILAAIGALIGAIALIAKVIETPTEKLERAKKAAKELNDEYQEVKDRAESLKSTFDSYDSVIKTLEECTENTKEWNNALLNVKKATLDIIEKYPELVNQMKFEYINGVRVISNLEEIQQKAQIAADRLQLISISTNMRISQQQNDINIQKLKDKYTKKGTNDNKINAVFDNVNYYGDAVNGFERLSNDLKDVLPIGELYNFQLELQQLAQDTHNLDKTFNETSISLANGLLSNTDFQEKVDNLKLGDFSNVIGEKISASTSNNINWAYDLAKQSINSENKAQVLSEYLNVKGLQGTFAGIQDGQFKYKTSNGDVEKVSIDTVLEAVAANRSLNYGTKVASELSDNILDYLSNNISKFSSGNKDLLTNLLSGQLSKVNVEDFKNMSLTGQDAQIFTDLYNYLNGTNINVNSIEQYIKDQVSLGDIYRSQIKDISSLQENIKNLNKTFGSLKFGDVVESLEGLSEHAKSYFQIMEDGTYKLVGNVQGFKDALFKESTVGFEENLQNYIGLFANQEINEAGTAGARSLGLISSGQAIIGEGEEAHIVNDYETMQANAIAYATATETLEQLEYVKTRFSNYNVDFNTQIEAENNALQDLASKYDSCKDDLENFQHALFSNNETLIDAAKKTLEYSIRVGELSEQYGFDAKETEAYAKRLKKDLAPAMKEAGFNEEQLKQSALTAAIANQRLDRGLTNLNKNLDSYKEILVDANKGTFEWSTNMDALKTDIADIVNMDMSVFTDEFAEGLLNDAYGAGLLESALNGDVEAIKKIQELAAQDMILSIKADLPFEEAKQFETIWDSLKENMAKTIETGGVDQSKLIASFNELISKGNMTKEQIEAALSGLHVAADIVTTYNKQKVKVPNYVTYETIEELPNPYGTSPIYKKTTHTVPSEPVEVDGWVPSYEIKGTTGSGSASIATRDTPLPPTSPIPGVSSLDNLISGVASGQSEEEIVGTSFTGTANPIITGFSPLDNDSFTFIEPSNGSTTKGLNKDKGGGSEKEATGQAELIEDEEHRYDELNKTLQGLSQQYERLGKARDRAWGKNKIALLEQEMQKLKQMQQVYEKYLKTVAGDDWEKLTKILGSGGNLGSLIAKGQAGGNLQKDYNKIVTSMADAIQYITKDEKGNQQRKTIEWQGLAEMLHMDIILDEFGQIANRDDIEEALEAWWNEHVLEWDRHNTDPQWQEEHDTFLQEAEAIREYAEKLLNQYDDSINVFTENYDKWMDNMYEQQAKAYETFRYKVDLKVEISERSLKRIEYAIKVLGDNIYKVPEVMRSWFDKRVTDTKAEVINQGSTWASAYQEAQSLYSSGQISQEDYVQTIKDAQDGLYGCVDALLEINEEMREYYKNVLSKVKDEMSRITNEMDHQLNTVQHLTNVLSLLGRQTDYEAIGKILDAQLQMSRNGYEVSKAQTEMYRRQVADAEATLQELLADGISEAALEEWKNAVLYPAKEALLEAESEMQADFEAYLEVINSIYENRINQIYQDSERRLSGAWGSFDQVNNALERQHALDDEYLTKTNQIYETNVLIKKLAQDLDKTNNDAAKLRIKNFSAEIEGLQQKNKLSKSELDIAKARYEVLLAEIALEDARNAKSTVRLQRDNEGNYGYVYTADGEQVDAAEDDLAKKNNDLYNLVLGQANDYTQKIIQLTQERNAALKDLDMAWAEGRITDEETYNKLREDINNKYNALIQEDYESYYRALYWLDQTAVTDHTEAWGTSFQDILDAGEDFQSETDTLMHETGEAIDWLNGIRAEATEEAKVGAGDLEEQLKDLTDQNDALAKTMIEEVIPASEETLTMAQALTEEWIRQYDEIMALIDAYLQLIDAMNAALNEMAGVNEEEFDANKDYSLAATQKFLETGVVDNDVIQQLLFRAQKEELNGGHNDKWWTNDQILELMDIASRGDNDARSADAMAFLQGIAGVNGDQQYYTSDRLAELGITGEGYSLEEFAKRLEENTNAQIDANRLAEEAKAQAESAQEATEESTEKTDENTEQSANTAQSIQDTAAAMTEDFQTLANETTGHFDETTQEAENIIKETSDNLINALNQNANVVSAAVQAAAQVIALSISQAAEYAARAEAAAAEAQAAAAQSIGGAEGLASGGYTGAWGSSGKLAVLHEKELVLNANDTENILSAISLVRDFASAIDLRAAASNISTGLSSPAYEVGSQTLEQSVTIHAEFPNATNHSEIEEAFNNLVNRASQYANRS